MLKVKNKLAKRILALVLSGAMIFSSVAPAGITAAAAEASTDTGGEYQEETAEAKDTGDGEKASEAVSKDENNASNKKEDTKTQETSANTAEATETAETTTEDEEQASDTESSLSGEKESASTEMESEEETTAEEEEKDEKDEDVRYAEPDPSASSWPKYAEQFIGSTFGNDAATGKAKLEVTSAGKMNITETGGAHKIGSSDGIPMYYYKVDSGEPFTLKARATVTANGATASNQSVVGIMARDDMYIDTAVASLKTDFIAACATNSDVSNNESGVYLKENGSLKRNNNLSTGMTVTSAGVGEAYDLGISYDGTKYTVEVNGQTWEKTGLNLQSVDQNIYVGMFATRKLGADFDRIYLATGANDANVIMDQRAEVSGSITGITTLADGAQVVFTDEDEVQTKVDIIKEGSVYKYTAKLYAGTYEISLSDSNYSISSGASVTVANKAAAELDAQTNDITVQGVTRVAVSGNIAVSGDDYLDDLVITFTKGSEKINVKRSDLTNDTYSVELAQNSTYTVSAKSTYLEDYTFDVKDIEVQTGDITNKTITFTEKQKQEVTVSAESFDDAFSLNNRTMTFTRGECKYELNGAEGENKINLREGTYSVSMDLEYPYMLDKGQNDNSNTFADFTVGQSAATYTVKVKERDVWDFTAGDPMLKPERIVGTDVNYNGLQITADGSATKFDVQPANKRVQFNLNTEVKIPVKGTGTVTIKMLNNTTGYSIENNGQYTNKPDGSYLLLKATKSGEYLESITVERTADYVPVATAEVTGEIDFPGGTLPADFKLVFKSADGDMPEVTIDKTQTKPTYTVSLQKDTEYTISATGANDYEITVPTPATVTASGDAAVNITFAEKQKYGVNFDISSYDNKLVQSKVKVTFTHADGDKHVITDLGQAQLRDGVYSIALNDLYPYMLDPASSKSLEVKGADATCTLNFVERTIWDFSTSTDPMMLESGNKTGTTYNGLVLTGGKFDVRVDDKQVQVNDGTTVKIPVSGKGKVQIVSAGANYTNYTVDGVAATDPNGEYSYDVTDAAESDQYVTLVSGPNTYLKKIVVTREEVPGNEEAITGKIVFPTGETIPAGLTLTFTPETGTAVEAAITGDDYTVTLNQGVTYTIAVTGAGGYNFAPSKMSTDTADKTITFTKKPAVTRFEWNFNSSDLTAPDKQINQAQGSSYGDNGVFDLEGLKIDVSNGKFSTYNRTSEAQVNAGTIIKIPVNGACRVTIKGYNENTRYEVDGMPNTKQDDVFICNGTDGWATFEMKEQAGPNGTYLKGIKVDPLTAITVTGNVTGATVASDVKLIFTGKADASGLDASKLVTSVDIANGEYEAELYKGITYVISLSDETYGIVGNAELEIAESDTSKTKDIEIKGLSLTTISGSVTFPTGKDVPADLKLQFKKDETTTKEVAVENGEYTIELERNTVYAVSATGERIDDYVMTAASAELDTTSATTHDIEFENAQTYPVTVSVTSYDDNAIDVSKIKITFTNTEDKEYVYPFTGIDNIALRDGTYSVSVSAGYPYVPDKPAGITISGANAEYAINFTKRIKWSFEAGSDLMESDKQISVQGPNAGENGIVDLEGLQIDVTNGKFTTVGRNSAAQVNNGTIIKIPVNGPSEVTIKGYNEYTRYTVDGVENTQQTESFVCQGTDGWVTFVMLPESEAKKNGEYLNGIEVTEIEKPVTPTGPRKIDVWDFGGKLEEDTDKYENNITPQKWIDANIIAAPDANSKPIFKEDGSYEFGDLTINYKRSDRLYSTLKNSNTDFAPLIYDAAGSGSDNKYADGYNAVGAWYCAGTGTADTRNMTIKNVISGDRIIVYGGQHQGADSAVTCWFEGQGLAKDQKESVAVGSGNKAFKKAEFIAEKSGTYKIWFECASGKAMQHRIMRIPGMKLSGTIDTKTFDIGNDFSVKFINQTTKQETPATLNGKDFEVSLADGYEYLAVLSGAPGYGFTAGSKLTQIPAGSSDITGKVLEVEQKAMYLYSGNFIGFADGYDISRLEVTMVPPANSNADSVKLDINTDTKTFEARLEKGLEYTIQMEGVDDYVIKSTPIVSSTEELLEEDIVVKLKGQYEVTGGFIGLEGNAKVTELKFTLLDEKGNPDSNYVYPATVNDSSYAISLRDGAYVADVKISDSNYEKPDAHVVVDGKDTYKDLMFVPKATGTLERGDIYVGYPGKKNNFKTIREAVKAAERMTRPVKEDERITIHIAPGVYREQVIVNTPYITFTNDEAPKEVKITWYYGIGYAYYSAKGGFYDEVRAHDKYLKGNADKWGCAVRVNANNFRAENIVFENSFNRYITEEEIADGVEVHTEGTDSGITFVRRAGLTDAQVASRAATERAAAIAIEGDFAEFYKCEFYGSQDTVYTGGGGAVHSYFKECLLEGNTDFLFGDSDSVYDKCTLSFAGYSDTDKKYGGYIAVNQASAEYGYLFTECRITRGTTYNNGFGDLGRPWRAGAKVIFADTTLDREDLITEAGWQNMSGASAENNPNYYEYNTRLPDGTEIVPKPGTVRAMKYKQPAKLPVKTDYFNGWTPLYLTFDETQVVKEPISDATSSDVATGTKITLTSATEGAMIYYTMDGTDPTESSEKYTVPIDLGTEEKTVVIKAIAIKNGKKSTIAVFEYKVASPDNLIAKPEASAAPGNVERGATVKLTCSTEGAQIYYTTDGTDPTVKAELLYRNQAIVINKSMTIKAIAAKDTNVSAVSEFKYVIPAAAPTSDVEEGEVPKGTKITLTSKTEGAKIYYTTDGSAPTTGSTLYEAPFVIGNAAGEVVIKAFAVADGYTDSDTVTFTYTVTDEGLPKLTPPTASPEQGEAEPGTTVTLTSRERADIYYTINGDEPTTASQKYEKPIPLGDKAGEVVIKAIAVKEGYADSASVTYTYTVKGTAVTTLTAPTATPGSGEVAKGREVVLSSAEDADIYYTTDGTDPLKNGTKYEVPIVIDKDMTIKAVAKKDGYENSEIATFTYTVTDKPSNILSKPTATPGAGEVEKGQKVVLSSAEDADIYYTTDGTSPLTNGTKYTAPIVIDKDMTIKAIARKDGFDDSNLAEYKYTVKATAPEGRVEAPVSDTEQGEVEKGTVIRLTSKTAGAKIYYTTDETTPTDKSKECTGLIPINETVTITAIAIKDDAKSAVVTFKYTVVEDPAVEIPDVYAVKFEDCEVIVPSIIRNTKNNADPAQPSATYVRFKYMDEDGKEKSVKFAEELDYTVQWNGPNKDDPYTYSVTLTGLGRTVRGRSVDGFIIDETSTCTVEYAVIDKPSSGNAGTVVDISKIKVSLDASAKNRVYTGYAIEPGVNFSKSNVPGDMLSVTYRNNINAGKAEVIISAKPGLISDDNVVYVGSKTLKFNIKKAAINKHSASAIAKDVKITWDPDFDINECVFSGKEIKVDGLKVATTAGKELKYGKDYKVTYKTNFRARKVTVTIKGTGNNISGSWSQNFTINPINLESLDFTNVPRMLTYSPKGARLTQMIGVNPENGAQYTLKEGVDYSVKYTYSDKKTKAAGSTVTVVISGKGACTGKNISLGRFEITKASFANVQLPDDIVADSKTYAKDPSKAVTKAVTVKDEAGTTLKLKKDYALTYDYNKRTLTVSPLSSTNYTGSKTVRYRVAAKLSSEKLFAFNKKVEKADPMKYDGRNPVEITQAAIDKYINIPNGTNYVLGKNIEIVEGTYKNNTKKGTGQVTIKGKDGVDNGFYGTKVLKFKIVNR